MKKEKGIKIFVKDFLNTLFGPDSRVDEAKFNEEIRQIMRQEHVKNDALDIIREKYPDLQFKDVTIAEAVAEKYMKGDAPQNFSYWKQLDYLIQTA